MNNKAARLNEGRSVFEALSPPNATLAAYRRGAEGRAEVATQGAASGTLAGARAQRAGPHLR